MRVLDASAILHAWDNYPFTQFPGLWQWLGSEMQKHELTIPGVALEEVGHKSPDCAKWLKATGVWRLPMTEAVVMTALSIKQSIGVVNDQYHPKGVDENDLLIVASAKVHGAELITNEARQFGLQAEKRKYKIPAVCDMADVKVENKNFLEYIQKSGQVF
ncbi:MAG: tRNA(fMet)-specific endonuclease VapC [Pseudomonadota bacterium]